MPEFDAIIVGPYLFGFTVEVARAFPEKTLLLPFFHDEPPAHGVEGAVGDPPPGRDLRVGTLDRRLHHDYRRAA